MKAHVMIGLLAGGLLGQAAGQAAAHHSFAAEFDANRPTTLEGIVTKVEWTNPHVWVYVNVEDEDSGDMVNWGVELGPPHSLQQRGWRRNTLSIGTRVSVDGFLARNGSANVNAKQVTLAASGDAPGEVLDAVSSQLDRDN